MLQIIDLKVLYFNAYVHIMYLSSHLFSLLLPPAVVWTVVCSTVVVAVVEVADVVDATVISKIIVIIMIILFSYK